jgi:hypothetical protein
MESLNTKEFLEKLNAGTLKPSFSIKGVVKKSAKADEVLFAPLWNKSQWAKIPAAMIGSVYVLADIAGDDGPATLVKLHLKPPTTDEGKTLFELLSHHDGEGHGHCRCGCHENGCKCGCHGGGSGCGCHGDGCKCGCQSSGCKCGCHEGGCKCGCQNKEQSASTCCCGG